MDAGVERRVRRPGRSASATARSGSPKRAARAGAIRSGSTTRHRAENASLDGGGHLVITARAEPLDSSQAMLVRKLSVHVGAPQDAGPIRADVRPLRGAHSLPRGQGIWPRILDARRRHRPRRLVAFAARSTVMENIGAEPARRCTERCTGPGTRAGAASAEPTTMCRRVVRGRLPHLRGRVDARRDPLARRSEGVPPSNAARPHLPARARRGFSTIPSSCC